MAWIDRPPPGSARVALAIFLTLLIAGCGTPRMGPDPEVFRVVDALYTAVSLHDPSQLDRCDQRLARLHDAGRLPSPAQQTLASLMHQARTGRWEQAQSRLRHFMLAQRH